MYRRVLFNFHLYNYQSAVKVGQWLISTLLCIYIYIYIYNRWHIRCIPRCDDSCNLTFMGWPKWYILGSTQESYSVEAQRMALEDESHPHTVLHITVPNMCKSSSKSCFLFNMKGEGDCLLETSKCGLLSPSVHCWSQSATFCHPATMWFERDGDTVGYP